MVLSAVDKAKVVEKFQQSQGDTGSVEVQVALLTADIRQLTEAHFKVHAQDNHSRRGLIRKVNLRKRLLAYLRNKDGQRYSALIQALGLRG